MSAALVAEEIAEVTRELPAASVERLAILLELAPALNDALEASLLATVVQPASRDRLRALLKRWREAHASLPPVALAWALRAASAGDTLRQKRERIDLVWSGPATLSQGVYRTQQTLLELIDGSARSLLIVTFAAYRVESIRQALHRAAARGVDVCLVVETDDGPGGKIDHSPLHELAQDPNGFRIFEWPVEARPRDGDFYGSLHAKCALADDEVLFVSSANMTGHAMALNMELGVLIRGGPAPARAAKHFGEMMRRGILRPWIPC